MGVARYVPLQTFTTKYSNRNLSISYGLVNHFLADVNSRSRSLYARPIADPSVVCRLSVTLLRPTQPVEVFGNFVFTIR